MVEWIIYIGSFLTLGLFLTGIYMLLKSRENGLSRLIPAGGSTESGALLKKGGADSKLVKALRPLEKKIAKEDGPVRKTRRNLMYSAGYYNPSAYVVFYASRFFTAALLAVIVIAILIFTSAAFEPMGITIIVTASAVIGYFLPLFFIYSKISDRKLKFSHGFPDALDMILICLESGLSFPASLKHVSKEFEDVHPVVSEQFEIATLEFQAGRKRSEALKNLADRVDVPEVRSITAMIIQSDILGTSLTRALRASSEDMRRDRMLIAEEKASALPAKMSVPLVVCIFPTLFAVIMVPVIIRIIRLIPG